jgi:predicted MFS family arabinose efflux permease
VGSGSCLVPGYGPPVDDPRPGRLRAVGGFGVFGVFWGAWGAALPAVQAHAGVSDGELGIALLFIGAGALGSMRIAGTIVDRWGAPALPAALAAFAAASAVPGLARSPVALCAALLVLGASSGAVDVAINAEAVRNESGGRPVMSLAHGTFSACVVGGSLMAGALRASGAGAELVLGLVGALVLGTAGVLSRLPAAAGGMPTRAGLVLRNIPRPLAVLGGLCALAFFVENAWQSWGAVHLEADLGASPGLGSLAPALFAAAAATSRFAGHGLTGRVGEVPFLRAGAALGAAGTLLAALAPGPALALAGVVIAGAGVSVCAPILLSMAGRSVEEAVRGAAVSIVTTIAYLGFVVGPATVGLLADVTSLPASLASVGLVALLLGSLAGRVERHLPQPGLAKARPGATSTRPGGDAGDRRP